MASLLSFLLLFLHNKHYLSAQKFHCHFHWSASNGKCKCQVRKRKSRKTFTLVSAAIHYQIKLSQTLRFVDGSQKLFSWQIITNTWFLIIKSGAVLLVGHKNWTVLFYPTAIKYRAHNNYYEIALILKGSKSSHLGNKNPDPIFPIHWWPPPPPMMSPSWPSNKIFFLWLRDLPAIQTPAKLDTSSK